MKQLNYDKIKSIQGGQDIPQWAIDYFGAEFFEEAALLGFEADLPATLEEFLEGRNSYIPKEYGSQNS